MDPVARRVVSPCEQQSDSVLDLYDTAADVTAVSDRLDPANRCCEWKDLVAARRRNQQLGRTSAPVASATSATRALRSPQSDDVNSNSSGSGSPATTSNATKTSPSAMVAIDVRSPLTPKGTATPSPSAFSSPAEPVVGVAQPLGTTVANPLAVESGRSKRAKRRVTMREELPSPAAEEADSSSASSGGSWSARSSVASARRRQRRQGDPRVTALTVPPSLLAAPFAADENTFSSCQWTLRFRDAQLEADYCVFHVSGRPSILTSCFLAVVICAGFSIGSFVTRKSLLMAVALIIPAWLCFIAAFVASILLSLRLSQLSFGMGSRNFVGRGWTLFPKILSQKSLRLHQAAAWNAVWQERALLLPQLGVGLFTAYYAFAADDCVENAYLFCLANYRMAAAFFMITANSLFLAPARFAWFVPLTLSGLAVFVAAAVAPHAHVNAEYHTSLSLVTVTTFVTVAFWITAYVKEASRRQDFVRECHLLEREMTVRYVRELSRIRIAAQVPPEALQILRLGANTTESVGEEASDLRIGQRCLTCPGAVVITLGIRGWGRWISDQSPTDIANVLQSCHLRLDAVLAQSSSSFSKLRIVGDTCMLASGLHSARSCSPGENSGSGDVTQDASSSPIPHRRHSAATGGTGVPATADRLVDALDLLLRMLLDEPHPDPLSPFSGRHHSSRFTVCGISVGNLCMQVVGRSAQVVFTGAAVADGAWLMTHKDDPPRGPVVGTSTERTRGMDVLLTQSVFPSLYAVCVANSGLWAVDPAPRTATHRHSERIRQSEGTRHGPSVWVRCFEGESFALQWSDATVPDDGIEYVRGSVALTLQPEQLEADAEEYSTSLRTQSPVSPTAPPATDSNTISFDGVVASDLEPVPDPLVDAAEENRLPPWELVRDWVVVYRFLDDDVEQQYRVERASIGVADPSPTRWAYVAATLVASGCLVASLVETYDADIVYSEKGVVPPIAWFSMGVALCCCGIAMTAPTFLPTVQRWYATVPAYVVQRVFYTLAFGALVTPLYTLGPTSFFAENDATAIAIFLFASAALPQSASPFTLMLLDLLHGFPVLFLAASPYSEHREHNTEDNGPSINSIVIAISLMYGYYCFVVRILVDRLHRGRFSTVKKFEAQAVALQKELTLLQDLQSIMIPNTLVSNMIDSVRATRFAATAAARGGGRRAGGGGRPGPDIAAITAQTRDVTAFSTPVQDTAILVVAITVVDREHGHAVAHANAERASICAMWAAIDESIAADSRVVKLKCTSHVGVIIDDSRVSDELSQAARLFEVAVGIRNNVLAAGNEWRKDSRVESLPRTIVSVVGVYGPAIGAVLGSSALSFDSLGATPLGAMSIATELCDVHAAFLRDRQPDVAHGNCPTRQYDPQDPSRVSCVLWFSDSFFTRCEQAWLSLDAAASEDWSSRCLPQQTLKLKHGVRCRGVQFI